MRGNDNEKNKAHHIKKFHPKGKRSKTFCFLNRDNRLLKHETTEKWTRAHSIYFTNYLSMITGMYQIRMCRIFTSVL